MTLAQPLMAQDTAAELRARALDLPLPESITDLIERGFDRRNVGFAMQDLYSLFAIPSNIPGPNHGLNAENRDFALKLSLARRRAAMIADVLIHDHDGDGTVTATEISDHFLGFGEHHVEELLRSYDIDFDARITPDELRAGVIRRIDALSNGQLLDQILTWDLNGDGEVHTDEVQIMSDARFRPETDPGR